MLISSLVDTDLPFVSIERPRMLADRVTYVSIDNVEAARMAVRHLIQIGRCRIGVIMGPADNTDAIDRLIGYRAALAEAGLPGSHQWEFVGNFSTETGLQGGRALLQQRVDAIFAGSDQIAVGLLQACREEGVRVPDDVAVIAFDDLPVAVQVTPTLTTIHHPIREKGAVATRLLLERIEGHRRLPQAVHLPTHLVVRESCGAGRSQFAAEGGDVSH
jgi:LacI family transcriptional regulator